MGSLSFQTYICISGSLIAAPSRHIFVSRYPYLSKVRAATRKKVAPSAALEAGARAVRRAGGRGGRWGARGEEGATPRARLQARLYTRCSRQSTRNCRK